MSDRQQAWFWGLMLALVTIAFMVNNFRGV
jgi:hypothetical protein